MTWNTSLVDGPVTVQVLGEPDAEGVRPVLGQVPGYHLNVSRSALPASAEAYEATPEPSTPVRVFAGDTQDEQGRYLLTAFLIFADEAEAIATLGELWTDPEPVPAEEA